MAPEGHGGERDRQGRQHDDGRMAEREEEAHGHRPLALGHQLAGDVVDGGDVVGVDRVAQAEAIGQERRAQKDGMSVECRQRPQPGGDIGRDHDGVKARRLEAQFAGGVVEDAAERAAHIRLLRSRYDV